LEKRGDAQQGETPKRLGKIIRKEGKGEELSYRATREKNLWGKKLRGRNGAEGGNHRGEKGIKTVSCGKDRHAESVSKRRRRAKQLEEETEKATESPKEKRIQCCEDISKGGGGHPGRRVKPTEG